MIAGTHQSVRYEAKQFDDRRMNKNEPRKYWRNPFKGEKCNKSPNTERVWLKSKEYGREHPLQTKVRLLGYANYICRPPRRPTFRFTFAYNVYSFHIFIRFPSPRSFCSVLKVAEQCFPRALFPPRAVFLHAASFSPYYTYVYFYIYWVFFSLILFNS